MQSKDIPKIHDVKKIVFSTNSQVVSLDAKQEYAKTIDNSISSHVNMRVHKY